MMSNREYVQAVANELEERGVYAFFNSEDGNDIYDIEYSVNGRLDFRGARAMIACGGPNVYIDSKAGAVDLYWGADEAHWYLSADCRAEVNEYFEEMYQMMRGC